jgi:hypothetical protein
LKQDYVPLLQIHDYPPACIRDRERERDVNVVEIELMIKHTHCVVSGYIENKALIRSVGAECYSQFTHLKTPGVKKIFVFVLYCCIIDFFIFAA